MKRRITGRIGVSVVSVNPRKEDHGEELVLAADMGVTTSKDLSTMLGVNLTLAGSGFTSAQAGVMFKDHKVTVKKANKSVAVLNECKLNKFVMTQEGDEAEDVSWAFRLQFVVNKPGDIGELSELIRDSCMLQITGPAQGDLLEGEGEDGEEDE